MSKHEITCKEIAGYEFRHRAAGHHCSEVNKSLDIIVKHKRVTYEVHVDRKVILMTPDLAFAVDVYNRGSIV